MARPHPHSCARGPALTMSRHSSGTPTVVGMEAAPARHTRAPLERHRTPLGHALLELHRRRAGGPAPAPSPAPQFIAPPRHATLPHDHTASRAPAPRRPQRRPSAPPSQYWSHASIIPDAFSPAPCLAALAKAAVPIRRVSCPRPPQPLFSTLELTSAGRGCAQHFLHSKSGAASVSRVCSRRPSGHNRTSSPAGSPGPTPLTGRRAPARLTALFQSAII